MATSVIKKNIRRLFSQNSTTYRIPFAIDQIALMAVGNVYNEANETMTLYLIKKSENTDEIFYKKIGEGISFITNITFDTTTRELVVTLTTTWLRCLLL